MKVRIICYEELDGWILGKFALKMRENLTKLGVDVDIAKFPDKSADINHHIIYINWDAKPSYNDTLMITHIDNIEKLNMIKRQMEVAKLGVCFSREHRDYLVQMGIDKNKLCYVNPAQDGVIPVKKIIIGLASKVHPDGRKNEAYFDKLAKVLSPKYFKFRIMGKGWEPKVALLKENCFEVDYFNDFDYEEYKNFIPSLDYYLYMGMDEGQIGVIDALAAGVKTIITTQGFHLEFKDGITHGFATYEELEQILVTLQEEKKQLTDTVSTWNWLDFSKKHLELWENLLDNSKQESKFVDGLNSLLEIQNNKITIDSEFVAKKNEELIANLEKHNIASGNLGDTQIKKYKVLGITLLKRKKTPAKVKYYLFGFLSIFVKTNKFH